VLGVWGRVCVIGGRGGGLWGCWVGGGGGGGGGDRTV